MAQARPQGPELNGLKYQLLPRLPSKINFKNLQFLKNKELVELLMRAIDELEKQRQATDQIDDKRYRKNLLRTLDQFNLPPEVKQYSYLKLFNNYYLLYDGVKKKANIGKGKYGCVKYGIDILTKEMVAVKILSEANDDSIDVIEMGKIESLRLKKIGQQLGGFPSISPTKDNQYHIVQKLVGPMTLAAFIASNASVHERLHVFLQVCRVVNDLHERGLIHGDLHTSNIMYNPADGTVKLIDLGMAREIPNLTSANKDKPFKNVDPKKAVEHPPEIFETHGLFTTKTDIFKIGRGMAHCFKFLDPNTLQLQALNSKELNFNPLLQNTNLRTAIYLIVNKMLQPKALIRPSLPEIMLELEEIIRRVSLNQTLREKVGIINVEGYIKDPDKKNSTQRLLNYLNMLKVRRVIFIDPSQHEINNDHIHLMQLLNHYGIDAYKKIFFEKISQITLEAITEQHFESLGFICNYFYMDFSLSQNLVLNMTEKAEQFNEKLATHYSKVLKPHHNRKALAANIEELRAEYAELKALSKIFRHSDVLLNKIEKILSSNSESPTSQLTVPTQVLERQLLSENKEPINVKIYITSQDGYVATIYFCEPNTAIKKVNCIFANEQVYFDKEALLKYKGPIQPISNANLLEMNMQTLYQHAESIAPLPECNLGRLIDAAESGEFDIVLRYIWKNQHESKDLNEALQWAACRGQSHIVKLLVTTAGINVNYMGNDETALFYATTRGHHHVVDILLETKGINVNQLTHTGGNNALITAVQLGYHKIVKALLAAGADVNHRNNDDESALLIAAALGNTKVIELLLKASNLDLNAKNKHGLTALDIATKNQYLDIMALLSSNNPQPKAQVKATLSLASSTTLLPYLTPKINFQSLQFLKNKNSVALLIRALDALEKQRITLKLTDDKRYRKKLLQTFNEFNLPPELTRYSFIKIDSHYYLLYDGVKKKSILGEGRYGSVKYGVNILTQELVAIKILTESDRHVAYEIIKRGQTEANYLAKAGQLLGAFPSVSPNKKQQFHIVQPLVRSCTLDTFNLSNAGVEERLHVFFQICKNVDDLHNVGVVHGDINVFNIIYNQEDGSVKLIDFGLASDIPDIQSGYRRDPAGTHIALVNRENAPEIFEPKGIASVASDVFNIGRVAAYCLRLLDKDYKIPLFQNTILESKMHMISDPCIRTSLYFLVRKMLHPIASKRPSLQEVMLEIEKIKRRVVDNSMLKENVGIINIDNYLLTPYKKTAFEKLKYFIIQAKIKRAILIDTCNTEINDDHIALMQLLEDQKVIVAKKLYFKNTQAKTTADIISEHFKSIGIIFNYFYYDLIASNHLRNDIVDKIKTYNERLAMLYSQVMNLKHRKKLLTASKSSTFKHQSEILRDECEALKALAQELNQTDLLLKKIEKTLENLRHATRPSKKPVTKENKPEFHLVSQDGFFTTIYNANGTKKIDSVFTRSGCVLGEALSQYRGEVTPVSEIYIDVDELLTIFKEIEPIKPASSYDTSKMINKSISGDLDIVLQCISKNQHLITSNAKISEDFSKALQWAAWHGHYQLAMCLMTTPGINLNYMGTGESALGNAAIYGHLDIAEALIAQGINVNLSNVGSGDTALTLAAECGHPKVVRALLAAGADVNHCNKEGNNALLFATMYGHTEVIVELLKAPSLDPNIKAKDGMNAIKLANYYKYTEIIHLLSDTLTLTPAKPISRRAI